jgi:hypothetical protein
MSVFDAPTPGQSSSMKEVDSYFSKFKILSGDSIEHTPSSISNQSESAISPRTIPEDNQSSNLRTPSMQGIWELLRSLSITQSEDPLQMQMQESESTLSRSFSDGTHFLSESTRTNHGPVDRFLRLLGRGDPFIPPLQRSLTANLQNGDGIDE